MRVACFYYDCGAGFKYDALKDVSFPMTSYALGGAEPQEQMGKSKKKNTERRYIIPAPGAYISKITEV